MLKRLNVSSEAQSEDEWVEILKLWHLGSHNVLMLAFQNSGTMATQRASFQLSDACYSSPFPCFSGLQALTECLLPASSQLNDVTVHLVGDDSSAARIVFFWSLSHFRKGSSFTQGPSKPLSLCLFVSRAPFSPQMISFLAPCDTVLSCECSTCQVGQCVTHRAGLWQQPADFSLHYPLLLPALEELLEQGSTPSCLEQLWIFLVSALQIHAMTTAWTI